MSHRKAKRERDAHYQKTVIKTGLANICKEPEVVGMLERAVIVCSRVSWEGSMLASYHVLRCLEENLSIEPLDQTFWDRVLAAIANEGSSMNQRASDNLKQSFELYKKLRPADYQPVLREPHMMHMILQLRETMLANFKVVFEQTFYGRLCRWLRLQILLGPCDDLKQPSKIKSAVSLLAKCCLAATEDIRTAVTAFSRLRDAPGSTVDWMAGIVVDVRQKLPETRHSPEACLPFFRDILRDIEAAIANDVHLRGIRAFSMLPQKSFRAVNVHVSNTGLKSILKELRKKDEFYKQYIDYLLEYCEDEELWEEVFKVRKVAKGRKKFACSLKTDGISASLTVEIPQESADKLPTKKKQKTAGPSYMPHTPRRIVGLDPGIKAPFTAAVYSQEAVDTLAEPTNTKFDIVSWTASKWYRENGYDLRGKTTRKWTAANPDIWDFNATVPTAKTASSHLYAQRIKHVLQTLPELLNFYVVKRRFRRLRWSTYMASQRATEKMIADICGTRNHWLQKDTVVAYGNASIGNLRGTRPVVQNALRRKLAARCAVADIDEFRTSKVCCGCHQEMRGKKLASGERLYGVRHCENASCHRIHWNRDANAAINMLLKYLRSVRGIAEPDIFTR